MLSKIFQFNKKLNQYRYIIPNNGDIISHIKNTDYDEYKMLTPTEFEKYHGGVCWDYVAYQADYFNTHFPKVSYKVYFLCFVNDDDNPTHTFMVFNYNDKYYWFESSWKKEQGIKMYNSEQDALNDIKHRMIEFDGRQFKKSFCIDFNPLDSVLFGMSCDEYKNYMSNLYKRNLYESVMTRTFEDTDEILREINEFHIANMIPQVGLSGSIIQKTEDDYKFNLDNIPESNILSDIMTEKSKIRKNDKGKVVPDKCPKCGSKIGIFLKGEPVYLCTNKKCNKYFGTLPCNVTEETHDAMVIDYSVTENTLISKDDYYFDFEKFESGDKNILFITGLTGSGKSTVGRSLASKYKAEYIELDRMDPCSNLCTQSLDDIKKDPKNELIYEYLKSHKDIHEKIQSGKMTDDEIFKNNCKFIDFIRSYANKHSDKRFIVEGLQIYEYCVFKSRLIKPMVIKGTSVITSFIRKVKREKWSVVDIIKNTPSTIKRMIKDDRVLFLLIKACKDSDEENVNESTTYKFNGLRIANDMNNKKYEPPMSLAEIKRTYSDAFYNKMKNCPIHRWRAESGIELIHKEPSLQELNRIMDNWNRMNNIQKSISDKKSIELFGCDNIQHYKKLLKDY